MVVYGNRQVSVGIQTNGDVNKVDIEIPKDIVKVGNSIDVLARPKDGVCWKSSLEFSTDKSCTKKSSAMTKVGTDSNTMEFAVTDNVISFVYKDADASDVDNDTVVAIVYHRNFN